MDLQNLYNQVKQYIDSVDFATLWDGFAPLKFALYNSNACFFNGEYIPKTDAFLANTAISYNGEMIAIWMVSEETDPRILASKIIHEMYHGYQHLMQESRFPDELDALYHYQYSDENLSLKLKEQHMIAELLTNFDAEQWNKILQIRKYRSNRFPYEYRYEACIEQIEGAAEYVELNALKQLSDTLYREKRNALLQRITAKENLLPIRIVCYDVGALLLLLMHENGIAYDSGFSDIPFSESLIADTKEYDGEICLTMGKSIRDYYNRADAIITNALSKNDVVSDGTHDILGVNVYNAVYHRNYIITRYCAMYGDREAPTVAYGDFLIETRECKKMTKLYRI